MDNKKNNKKTIFIHIVFIIVSLIYVIPFLTIITISITSEQHLNDFGYKFIPTILDFSAYKYIFKNPMQILNAYKVSIIITVVTTFFGVFIMSMTAYCLARKNFVLRKQFMFFIFFTMLFSGGMVPKYILITQYLKLADTIGVLILPTLVGVFHIILLRTFMVNLPTSLLNQQN